MVLAIVNKQFDLTAVCKRIKTARSRISKIDDVVANTQLTIGASEIYESLRDFSFLMTNLVNKSFIQRVRGPKLCSGEKLCDEKAKKEKLARHKSNYIVFHFIYFLSFIFCVCWGVSLAEQKVKLGAAGR